MKFRYWLSILLVIVVAIIGVSSCGSSSAAVTPPIFFNAQKSRLRGPPSKRPPPTKAPGMEPARAAALDKRPICKPEDTYCVTLGNMACNSMECALHGRPCIYSDYNCVKSRSQGERATPSPTVDVDAFENCIDTRSPTNCQSKTCVHYTCNTAEDAQRINMDTVNIKCVKRGHWANGMTGIDGTLQCKTVGNTTYCECAPIFASDNKACPDGLVPKTIKTTCSPSAFSLENISRRGDYPICKPGTGQNYTVCVKPDI